jgi:hypothetical protein
MEAKQQQQQQQVCESGGKVGVDILAHVVVLAQVEQLADLWDGVFTAAAAAAAAAAGL